MVSFLIALIGIIITILFVIGTHEAGHFFMARFMGVKVLRFSIGFGKRLFSWKDKSGTEYVFALIPLGGYVKMLDEHEGAVPENEKQFAYNRQPFYKKFLIVLAGPFVNGLCAFLLYWLIFTIGFTTLRPIIGEVAPHSIAAESGLKPNQEILQINHKSVLSWTGILFRLITHMGDKTPLMMTVSDKNKEQTYSIDLSEMKLNELNPDPLSGVGITPYTPKPPLNTWPKDKLKEVKFNAWHALPHAAAQVSDLTYFNFILFGKMLTGKLSLQSLGGPITIFSSAGSAFQNGFMPFVSFLAFLSLSVGIINILPIPGLDGGHLLIQTIEFVIRKPLSDRMQIFLFKIGLFFIIFIFIQALINDVLRFW
jgi:regulator of sigma E protease